MASRDEWFAIHTADSGDGSLSKSAGPRSLAGGFRIDSEAAPAVRTAFEEAVNEMQLAQDAINDLQFQRGGNVNPVVDKYVGRLAEVAYGDQGSATMAADSAITEYQNVIDQLNQVMAGYKNIDDQAQDVARRLRS